LSPSRPDRPLLLSPRDVPRRRPGTPEGRIAILHAVAHIELNAVDLHWDIIARFGDVPMPKGFHDDWVKAADEESKHFNLICDCLEALGSHYGALPAHAGMWRAAEDTADDLMGRLAVVPMVLEARGLDVTPGMIDIFRKAGDAQAVDALEVIYGEEVGHVAYGSKWFHFLCGRHDVDPKEVFHTLVQRYFHGPLKPPFNEEKRAEAGLPPDFYWPLAEGPDRA
ncbi:MAG: ferritin-like domain-containing protein, partial [Paracoccaceae bacterium]